MSHEQKSNLHRLLTRHPFGSTIKPIHDFDENKSIIGYQLDHPSLGDKGEIFNTHAEAKQFVCDLYNSVLDMGETK